MSVIIFDKSTNDAMHQICFEIQQDLKEFEGQQVPIATVFNLDFLKSVFRADMVLSPGTSIWNVPLAITCRLLATPCFVGIHDVKSHEPSDTLKVYLYNKVLCLFCTKIITFSLYSKEQLEKIFGADSLLYYFGSKSSSPISTKRTDVIYFGRLMPYQGVNDVELLIKGNPDISFLVAGRGAPSSLNALENVRVLDYYVPEEELLDHIADSKVALFPYKSATQSGGIPIALSRHCNIVAYDVGGLRDQASPADMFFAEGANITDLSIQIRRALESDFDAQLYSSWINRKQTTNKEFFLALSGFNKSKVR